MQNLEEEIQFLEAIKDNYNQLMELQLGFRKVCELYGAKELKLSDLSQLNIDYVDNRINTRNYFFSKLTKFEQCWS